MVHGSVVARLTVVLQSWVQIPRLPSPQLTANLLVSCHLGWRADLLRGDSGENCEK